jgi:hypothetical protein
VQTVRLPPHEHGDCGMAEARCVQQFASKRWDVVVGVGPGRWFGLGLVWGHSQIAVSSQPSSGGIVSWYRDRSRGMGSGSGFDDHWWVVVRCGLEGWSTRLHAGDTHRRAEVNRQPGDPRH